MRTFFVLAMGRSGTHFLTGLLASDRRGVVHHEPNPVDRHLVRRRPCGGYDVTIDRLLDARFDAMLERAGDVEFYGEVNSLLRYEVPYLRRRFDPTLIHLIRDGRAFVRSAWTREIYTEWESEGPVLPLDDDPIAPRWAELSRFERLCWAWAHANRTLAAGIADHVRFEDLLRDYAVFRERVLEPTGVQVSEATWRREIDRPSNTSRRFAWRSRVRRLLPGRHAPVIPPLPHWREWDDDRRRRFRAICGDTMRQFGYEP